MKNKQYFQKLLRLNRLPEFDKLSEEQRILIQKSEKSYKKFVHFDIPDKFCVVHTQMVADHLNQISGGYYSEDLGLYSHFPKAEKNGWSEHCYDDIQPGYKLITQEQFKKYLKNEN